MSGNIQKRLELGSRVAEESSAISDIILASQRVKKVVEFFSRNEFNRILDVGCGDGSISVVLKEVSSADEVYGVDLSEVSIVPAKKKEIKAYRLDIDRENFPFGSEYFDAVFAGEIIEHLVDTDHLLDEVHRVLKKGGFFVITTPNLSSWLNRVLLLLGFQPMLTEVSLKYNVGKPGAKIDAISRHIRAFTYKALKELLELHGFKIIKSLGAGSSNFNFPINLAEKLTSYIPSLSTTMIFVCTRNFFSHTTNL